MFETLQQIYFKIKLFINYISCKLALNSEEPYYEELPEEEIKL